LKYGKGIHVDQKIKIPLGNVTREHFEELRFEFHKEIAEDFFNAYHIEQVRTYRIKKGDNIWRLCNDVFEIPVWLLKRYNANLDFNDIRATQSIRVPVVEKKTMDMPLWMTRLRGPLLKS
jgi:membrane-bound lytic murein transglycosylase D